MPCIHYVPKLGVIASHANNFVAESQVKCCFSLSEAPVIRYDTQKDEQLTWSGRPCITTLRENLYMSLVSAPILTKDKPKWVEFMRSTKCGETLRVEPKTLPINCWRVNGECVVSGVPQMNIIDKFYFSMSFTLLFWDF